MFMVSALPVLVAGCGAMFAGSLTRAANMIWRCLRVPTHFPLHSHENCMM
jgi:hypothetical protein